MMSHCPGVRFGSLTHATGADVAGCLIVNCSGIAKAHALRVAITQIAFENAAPPGIPSHGTKGTGCNTHFAADAEVMIDGDACKHFIAVDGIFGTDFQTGSIFTLLTAHRYINADMFPFNHLNPGQRGVAHPKMPDRTDELAVPATGAFFRIYRQ